MKIVIACPSYKRPKVETLDYIPYCRVYVAPEEYDAYKLANPDGDIVKCAEGVQWNLCRVRNYILDEEFKNWADVVLIIDDDLKKIGKFIDGGEYILTADDFLPFLEKYSIMARDLWVYFWWINVNSDKKCYREYSPFSMVAYIWWPFQCFLKDGGLRYDERLPLKEDYDMTLQQCNKYRRVLRVNAYHYFCKQSEQSGGCATYRNIEREIQQFEALQKKWGSKIVKRDTLAGKKNRKYEDYNPVIHIPIKWI